MPTAPNYLRTVAIFFTRWSHPLAAVPALAIILALAFRGVADAAEPTVVHTTAGTWQSTDFRDAANPGCSMGGPGSVPGSRLVMGASLLHASPMNVVVRKTGWSIPPNTPIEVLATFPDGSSVRLSGSGKGNTVNILLDADQLPPWVHGLTASSSMQLSFGGTEAPWAFDLSGTTAMVNAMGDCFRAHGIAGVAAPFSAQSTQVRSSQPFGAASPTVPEPSSSPAAPTFVARPQPATPPPAYPALSTPAPGQQPASAPSASGERVLMSWVGSGRMQTRPFHVDGPWELQWTRASGYFSAVLHPAVGTEGRQQLLANGSQANSSTSYQPIGGDFYFEFDSSQQWTARIVAVPDLGPPPTPGLTQAPAAKTASAHLAVVLPTSRPPPPVLAEAADQTEPPQQETALLEAVDAARQQYRDAGNEMSKGASRPIRARAICRAVTSPTIQGWIGKIDILSTNGDGKGVISIEVGRGVYLKTWNNSLSDISDHTLIDPASATFQTASRLSQGQAVRFSAMLILSNTDCYKEASMTMDGSITKPEFIMRLTAIEAIP